MREFARRIGGPDAAFWATMLVALLGICVALYAVDHHSSSAAEAAYNPRPNVATHPSVAATPAVPTTAAGPEVAFGAVGESVTEVNSPDFPAGQIGSDSWVSIAGGSGLRYVGGWAKGAATTRTMLNNVRPISAEVLVILAGTADISQKVPFVTSSANLSAIAKIVGSPRVVVCSIPPVTENPAKGTNYNAQLQTFAASVGWEWLDCSAGLRNGDVYVPSLTNDGVLPNPAGQMVIASAVRQYLLKR